MKSAHTLITIATVLVLTTLAAAEVTFTDGEFAPEDWELTVVEEGNGGTASVERQLTGGAPGAYQRITLNVNSASGTASRVFAFQKKVGATYDPSVSGEIDYIDYTEMNRLPQGTSFGQPSGPAIWQDGDIFLVIQAENDAANWTYRSLVGLTAEDFRNDWDNPTAQPDFSENGSPMEFGFYRVIASTDSGSFTAVGDVDNWSMTVVPEPASLVVFASTGLLAYLRRRAS